MEQPLTCIAYDPADQKTCLLAACPEGHVNVLHPDNSVSCVKLPESCFDEAGVNMCALSPMTPNTSSNNTPSCLLYKGVPQPTNKVCLVDDSMVACGVGEMPVLEIMKATGHARVVCRKANHLEQLEDPSTASHLRAALPPTAATTSSLHCGTNISPLRSTRFAIVESGTEADGDVDDDDEDNDSDGFIDDGEDYAQELGLEDRIILVVTTTQPPPPTANNAQLPMIYYGGLE